MVKELCEAMGRVGKYVDPEGLEDHLLRVVQNYIGTARSHDSEDVDVVHALSIEINTH